MKKLLLIAGFIFLSQFSFAQTLPLDSCGLDTAENLNKCETDYFNEVLKNWRKDFDFKDKKIAFAYGNFGKNLISKKEYFERWGKAYYKGNGTVSNVLLILNSEEKNLSGGYDAIIVSWSKPGVSPKNKKTIIQKLKKRAV